MKKQDYISDTLELKLWYKYKTKYIFTWGSFRNKKCKAFYFYINDYLKFIDKFEEIY